MLCLPFVSPFLFLFLCFSSFFFLFAYFLFLYLIFFFSLIFHFSGFHFSSFFPFPFLFPIFLAFDAFSCVASMYVCMHACMYGCTYVCTASMCSTIPSFYQRKMHLLWITHPFLVVVLMCESLHTRFTCISRSFNGTHFQTSRGNLRDLPLTPPPHLSICVCAYI